MMFSDGIRSASRIKCDEAALSGHRQRLRSRAEQEGWEALRPHEMVELVLYYAVPRQDLSAVARALVERFGSVGGVFSASREALAAVPGVTGAMAEWLALTGELMDAYHDLHDARDVRLLCYRDVLAFLMPWRARLESARAWALFADFEFDLMTLYPLEGTAPWSDADQVRRLVSDAITLGARYVFFVRRVDDLPAALAPEELARLEAVATTLQAVSVDLVDCVLLAPDGFHSMSVDGTLRQLRALSNTADLRERYIR